MLHLTTSSANIIKDFAPVFIRFLESIIQKESDISNREWLEQQLRKEIISLQDNDIEQLGACLAEGIESHSTTLNSIKIARDDGMDRMQWLNKAIPTLGAFKKAEIIKNLKFANAVLTNESILNDQNVEYKKTTDELMAIKCCLDKFNVLDDCKFYADIDIAGLGARYGYDFHDISIRDKFSGDKVDGYQVVCGETSDQIVDKLSKLDNYGQKIIMPQEFLSEVRRSVPEFNLVDRINREYVLTGEVEPLLKEDVEKNPKEEELCCGEVVLSKEENIFSTVDDIMDTSILNVNKIRDVDLNALDNILDIGVVNKLIGNAIVNGDFEDIKLAATGAIATCIHNGAINLLPKNTHPFVISSIAATGVENIKILYELSTGKIDSKEAVNKFADLNLATIFEYAFGKFSSNLGVRALSFIPVVGPLISNVLSCGIMELAGSQIKEYIGIGLKRVAPVLNVMVGNFAKGIRKMAHGIAEFVFG